MALTYSAGAGMAVTSFCVSETLGAQTQQTGNNTVVMSDVPYSTAGYGGNGGDGTNGAGDSYINRRILIDRAGTPQERIVTAQSAGTGATQILTVHEDWDTNPVSTDTADVYYEYPDMEDGSASGGIALNTRSGLYELARIITIGNGTDPAGLATHGGLALECADRGTADSFLVQNNGYFRAGYYSSGQPIDGGIFAYIAKSDDEPGGTYDSGSNVQYLDSLIWGQVAILTTSSNTGTSVVYGKTKLLRTTLECELYGDQLNDLSVVGSGLTTEIARVDDATTCTGLVLVNMQVLDTVADTTTETLELEGVVFAGVPGYVDVRQNKTWNLIDPSWDVTTYTELTWTGTSTGNELNDRRSIKVTAQEADGTLLQDALVNVYENTQLADLVLELTTDVNGYAEGSFIYKKHATNSATTTYGGHALQAGKWLYLPFVAAQVSTDSFEGSIVLSSDNNIVQTTQATALTDGSGVVWNEDTNPSELFDFTLGSGTLAVGMILTFAPSGAIGTITDSLDGDSVAGTIHLDTRNATTIDSGDTFSRTGGTAGTFSGTFTTASNQQFSIHIDGNAKSFQTIYDYIAAKTTETTLSADGELIWEWCRSAQTQALYSTGTSFFTEQSNSKGIIIVDGGAGTVDYFTDDTGATWTPPSSVTLTVQVDDADGNGVAGARVRIEKASDGSLISNGSTNGSGLYTDSFTYTTDVSVLTKVRLKGYRNFRAGGTISSSGLTVGATLSTDKIVDLP